MVRHALSLFIKIVLFAVLMIMVAKWVPYDGLVESIVNRFDYQSAEKVTHFILGEPDTEVIESLFEYFSIIINTLISVPLLSILITAYIFVINKTNLSGLLRDCALSTLRRFAKIFGFTFLFWGLFRVLPYESLLPKRDYSGTEIAAFVISHLLLTTTCYWLITNTITFKRNK